MIASASFPRPRNVAVLSIDSLLLYRVEGRGRVAEAHQYFERRRGTDQPDPGWEWLEDAAAEAAADGTVPPEGSVDLVLARPLASTRTLVLPPARTPVLRRLLGANRSRYFPWGEDGVVVDAWYTRRSTGGECWVAAVGASEETVTEALDALEAGGIRIRRILAAPMAVAKAVGRLQGHRHGEVANTIAAVFSRNHCELIQFAAGEPSYFVPLPLSASAEADAAALDHAVRKMLYTSQVPQTVIAFGDMGVARSRVDEAETPFEVLVVDGATSLEAAAALGAVQLGAEAPDLSPPIPRARRDRSRRRRTVIASAVACGALFLAAQLHLIDLRRELDATRHARTALAPTVEDAIRTRSATDLAWSVVSELTEYEGSRPSWTAFIAQLADALPPSVYVTRLEATPDSIVIAGEAAEGIALPLPLEGGRAVNGVSLVASPATNNGENGFSARFAMPSNEMVGPPEAGAVP